MHERNIHCKYKSNKTYSQQETNRDGGEKQRYGAVCAEAKGINIKYRHDNKPLLSTIFIIQCEFNIMYAYVFLFLSFILLLLIYFHLILSLQNCITRNGW